MKTDMLLSLVGVAKIFGTRVVFKQVTLDVAPGSVTLLVGANGAGKSTLLRIMAGLASPSLGTVENRVDATGVGYLGHATFIYPGLTAWENLAFWRDASGLDAPDAPNAPNADDAAIDAALARVELRVHAHERAGVFSRGMAQRLNLARVLLLAPQLLLLDEPGTGLDVRSAGLLRREIGRAKERGAGVVWISHDLAGDIALADRVVALHAGRVAYDGPALGYDPSMTAPEPVADAAGRKGGQPC